MLNASVIQMIITAFVVLLSNGVLAYILVPRTRQKDQDDLIRNELWNKVQNLDLKYEKLMLQYIELNAEYAVLKNESNLSIKFDELITTIKHHQ